MITPIKALFATIATGAMAVSAVAPAMAHDGFGDGFGHARGWNGGNSRNAVEACSRAAERTAARNGYERANVSDIRDIRDTRFGFEVRGRIAVRDTRGGWRDLRHNGNRGWNDRGRGFDTGSFTCRFERGQVVDLDIDGIRRL